MKAYKLVTRFPSGEEIETATFRSKEAVDKMMEDSTMQIMHALADATMRCDTVKVSLWKWLVS